MRAPLLSLPLFALAGALSSATAALAEGEAPSAPAPAPADKPADKPAPAADAPADKPAADAPADKPAAGTPAAGTPAAGTPAADKPAADEPAATAAQPAAEATRSAFPPWAEPELGCPDGTLLCFKNDVVAIWPKVRIRPGFKFVEPDSQILYIGENDGFFLDSARIGAEGNVENRVRFKLTVETASLLPGGHPNDPITPLLAAATDAWVAWTPSRWIIVQAGQQIMPSEYEGGDVAAEIPFTHPSVMAGGVRNGEGNAVAGLSPGRQIGIVVGSAEGLRLNADIPLEYRLGISNGNGQNLLGNDNKLPAAYLRLGSGWGDILKVGVGGRFNPRTVGTLPNLYTETDAVLFVDSEVDVAGFEAVVELEGRQTALTTLVPDPQNPAGQETASGAALWLGYKLDLVDDFGVSVTPAYRVSFYDPSSSFQTDQLLENTIGVRVDGDARKLPLSFLVDYTVLTELGDLAHNVQARDIADNRLTALFQIEL